MTTLTENQINWLASGERGSSSNTMFTHLTGFDAECMRGLPAPFWKNQHPSDPDDLSRCRLLLEDCPELAADLDKMKTCSDVWKSLVENWNELCLMMDKEAPNWRQGYGEAPETFRMMRKMITEAEI